METGNEYFTIPFISTLREVKMSEKDLEALITELGIKPAFGINFEDHYTGDDVVKIVRHLRAMRKIGVLQP